MRIRKILHEFQKSTHTHKYLKVQQYDTARATDIYFVVVASVAAISLFIFHTFVLLLFFFFLSLFYIIGFICVSFFSYLFRIQICIRVFQLFVTRAFFCIIPFSSSSLISTESNHQNDGTIHRKS